MNGPQAIRKIERIHADADDIIRDATERVNAARARKVASVMALLTDVERARRSYLAAQVAT